MTVIHQAGPWLNKEQRCTQCGEVLASINHPDPLLLMPYPEGALIEVARTYRAMTFIDDLPTCTPPPTAQAGAGFTNAESDKVQHGAGTASILVAPIGSGGTEA